MRPNINHQLDVESVVVTRRKSSEVAEDSEDVLQRLLQELPARLETMRHRRSQRRRGNPEDPSATLRSRMKRIRTILLPNLEAVRRRHPPRPIRRKVVAEDVAQTRLSLRDV
jgi:uncharacterized protein with von Willebrand factor type A (vWA) domain